MIMQTDKMQQIQYCSKRCQKMHWNAGHDKECDRRWEQRACNWQSDLLNSQETTEFKEDLIFEMENLSCKKHDKYTEDCGLCRHNSSVNCIPINYNEQFIDKLKDANNIVAPKRFVLILEHKLPHPCVFEIKIARSLSRKELIRTVCDTYKTAYWNSKKRDKNDKALLFMYLHAIHRENGVYTLTIV